MNDELNIRTEEANLRNALAALGDFKIPEGLVAGFEYTLPEAFKSELDEIRLERASILSDIDPEVLAQIPAEIIARLQTARTRAELEEAKQTFTQALDYAIKSIRTEREHDIHDEEKRNARIAHLDKVINQAKEEISDDLDELLRSGKISRELWLELKNERRRIDAMPDGPAKIEAERNLAAYTAEQLEPVRAAAVRNNDVSTVETIDNIATAGNTIITAEEEQDQLRAEQVARNQAREETSRPGLQRPGLQRPVLASATENQSDLGNLTPPATASDNANKTVGYMVR